MRIFTDSHGKRIGIGKYNALTGHVPGKRLIERAKYMARSQVGKLKRIEKFIVKRLMNWNGLRDIEKLVGEYDNWGGRHIKPGASRVIKTHGKFIASYGGFSVYNMSVREKVPVFVFTIWPVEVRLQFAS